MSQARLAIFATGSQEWFVPVLFMRAPDGHLFHAENRGAVTAEEVVAWHWPGAAWLTGGLLGLVLLVGLGELM